jgi:D-3-phosphoglycerate dehydrogenase
MLYKVLIPQDVVHESNDYLRERGYEIKMGAGIAADTIAADMIDRDAILARTAPFPAKVFGAGKKLKAISRHGVSDDNDPFLKPEQMAEFATAYGPIEEIFSAASFVDSAHPRHIAGCHQGKP